MTFNFDFIYETGMKVIDLGQTLFDFLSYNIEIPGLGTWMVYEIAFGTGLIVIIVASFVKAVVWLL